MGWSFFLGVERGCHSSVSGFTSQLHWAFLCGHYLLLHKCKDFSSIPPKNMQDICLQIWVVIVQLCVSPVMNTRLGGLIEIKHSDQTINHITTYNTYTPLSVCVCVWVRPTENRLFPQKYLRVKCSQWGCDPLPRVLKVTKGSSGVISQEVRCML